MDDVLFQLASRADQSPSHPAVVQGTEVTTYSDFYNRVRRMASAIASEGEGPRVLIHLPQSADAYATMFAAGMAGGFYAPTNTSAPLLKQRQLLDAFAPDVIVSTPALFRELLGGRSTIHPKLITPADAENWAPLHEARAFHDLSYVIFTSGSTGTPKGVMIPRSALNHFVNWARTGMQISSSDRWSQQPNIAFDLSVLDIYGALCGGATLFPIVNPVYRLFPARAIRELKLTVWNSVPSLITLMMRSDELAPENLATLRLMTFCGEPLLPEHLDAIFAARPDLVVQNTYGPTEATVSCTSILLTAANYRKACRSSVALGDSIPDMDLLLMPGPRDLPEAAICGPQLARGYWNSPEETARAFRQVDINGVSARAYFTGDLMKREEAGLFFAGRQDMQVKRFGHRLELEEVNAAIRRCGHYAAASVIIKGELHAFVESAGPLDEAGLREQLSLLLEPHAVPAFFHVVDHLPRNTNDKIDISAWITERPTPESPIQ